MSPERWLLLAAAVWLAGRALVSVFRAVELTSPDRNRGESSEREVG